ncbi:MAG: hypothetical protein QG660_41 [Pseudomonadota bacterium]|nr:hypothetical protein [Pseudomonadota bacterium]
MSLQKKPKRPRPHLTFKLVFFGLIDCAGMVLLAIGGFYFSAGPGAVFKEFPSSTAEAVGAIVLGTGIMFWAAAQILREVIKQPHMMKQEADGSDL